MNTGIFIAIPSAGITEGTSQSSTNPRASRNTAGRTVLLNPKRSISFPKKNVTAAARMMAGAIIST